MMAPISLGYLQPAPSRIRSSSPEIRSAGQLVYGMLVPDWHYLVDITVEWLVDIDIQGLMKDCGLNESAKIGAILVWRSAKTNLRGAGNVANASGGPNRLTVFLPGRYLGGSVTIEARIVLLESGEGAARHAPSRVGSLLWRESHQVTLEGSGGRFPTIALDFASKGIPGGSGGLWYLEARDSLGASVTEALRLFLNSSHPTIRAMLDNPRAEASRQLLRTIQYDTSRQLLSLALRSDDFDDRAEYGKGTLGDILVTLVRIYFPSRGIAQLRNDYNWGPSEIDAELLAAVWGSR
jgi:hypothetical protein